MKIKYNCKKIFRKKNYISAYFDKIWNHVGTIRGGVHYVLIFKCKKALINYTKLIHIY